MYILFYSNKSYLSTGNIVSLTGIACKLYLKSDVSRVKFSTVLSLSWDFINISDEEKLIFLDNPLEVIPFVFAMGVMTWLCAISEAFLCAITESYAC